MKVALLSPPWYPVPPSAYGGTELVVYQLAEGLVREGAEVTLFATGDSRTSADLAYVYETAPSERIGESIWELDHVLFAMERAHEFDVVHDHSGPLGVSLLGRSGATVVHTVHGPMSGRIGDLYARLCQNAGEVWLTSISSSQRRGRPDLPWLANVPNGIDLERYPLAAGERDGYLLFLGRMCEEKGAHRAIEVARAARLPLRIAAKCREPAERAYFRERVKPHLGDGVEYVGEVSFEDKLGLIQRALATLAPIEWEEPFGLVLVESAACGTPVIATRRGSVPEVVVDGVTGIVVDHHRDMPSVLDAAARLDPARMREEIARRFRVEHMVSGYLRAYELALRARRARGRVALEPPSLARDEAGGVREAGEPETADGWPRATASSTATASQGARVRR